MVVAERINDRTIVIPRVPVTDPLPVVTVHTFLSEPTMDPVHPYSNFKLHIAPSTPPPDVSSITSPVQPTTSPAPANDEPDVPDDWEMLDIE